MIKKFLKVFAILLLSAGMILLSYPFFNEYKNQEENRKIIEEFDELRKRIKIPELNYSEIEDVDEYIENNSLTVEQIKYLRLYKSFQEYNERIFKEKQKTLCDAFSYTTNDFEMESEEIDDDVIGYLWIPAMEQDLPMYIGASVQNMAKGATVLSQTSMPIGGNNTNCVIAAHRGYRGIPMFLDIEKLQIGDSVQVVNLWEELDYTVIGITVIDPFDVDAIKIVPDYDMITLITCHPYSKNYQRYVVYCVRDIELDMVYSGKKKIFTLDGRLIMEDKGHTPQIESSEKQIKSEKELFMLGFGICAVALFYILFRTISDVIEKKIKKK